MNKSPPKKTILPSSKIKHFNFCSPANEFKIQQNVYYPVTLDFANTNEHKQQMNANNRCV